MIAGLPLSAWVLIISSVGIGLSIVLKSYFAHHLLKSPKKFTSNNQDNN